MRTVLKLIAPIMLMAWSCSIARAEVAVTLPPLAGIVRLLAPDTAVFCLLPANADPHHFSVTPRRIERLRHSDILIRASRDDRGWLGLDSGLSQIDLWPDRDHAWLQPEWLLATLPLLAKKLQSLHPGQKDAIAASLSRVILDINAMDRDIFKTLEPVRRDGVILQHASWRHFCEHYGIPVLAIANPRHIEGSLRPKQLERLLTTLRRHPGARLWGDRGKTNSALKWLAERVKHKPITLLDPLGNCNGAWPQLIRDNVTRMVNS